MRVDKLEGSNNWTKWRRQIELLLRHYDVLEYATESVSAPTLVEGTNEEAKTAHEKQVKIFRKSDALAQLILLVSVYEQSSGHRLDRLMEKFFTSCKEASEDVTTHVSRLQRKFYEFNDELKRVAKTELPELLLMTRIMPTLNEYFEFKSVWESVPLEDRTLNLLTEMLRCHEGPCNTSSDAFMSDSVQETTDIVFVRFDDGVQRDMWLADSGATAHRTKNREYFVTYSEFLTPLKIMNPYATIPKNL
ncbi:uncharacterized protein LOC123293083 [Chrysoperla carnea]|uniref:uncharacterized protein LOC123293083 n=1 Tax=Chrysoperla carnea TaxID=189513 RepID=UPI001D07DE0B|nr:uncharacterized protein LOC123293083 [Chrysoperla carnea]